MSVDLEGIQYALRSIPMRVIGLMHPTLHTLVTEDMPAMIAEIAAARAEIAEHKASLKAKQEVVE